MSLDFNKILELKLKVYILNFIKYIYVETIGLKIRLKTSMSLFQVNTNSCNLHQRPKGLFSNRSLTHFQIFLTNTLLDLKTTKIFVVWYTNVYNFRVKRDKHQNIKFDRSLGLLVFYHKVLYQSYDRKKSVHVLVFRHTVEDRSKGLHKVLLCSDSLDKLQEAFRLSILLHS